MTKAAAVVWKRLAGSMPAGVWTAADENLLTAYCEAVAMHAMASEALQTQPVVMVRGTGALAVSPWVAIQSDKARLMASLGARLGLDPLARQAINAPPEESPKSTFNFN
ncbi:phage terminase small subunit P27 family [Caulobacter sp. UC70_42]|uniref:phage terminase small subunit P27 family n=1 Tax=Caulobacter sp. UC70_42 TaxID=3374551 RepID=UPI0037576CCA